MLDRTKKEKKKEQFDNVVAALTCDSSKRSVYIVLYICYWHR